MKIEKIYSKSGDQEKRVALEYQSVETFFSMSKGALYSRDRHDCPRVFIFACKQKLHINYSAALSVRMR